MSNFEIETVKDERKRIGKLLKERRENLNYTQEDVATYCGVKTTTINKIENGAFSYSLDIVFKMSEFLDLEIELRKKDV